jgi:hypothetical protein
LICRDKHPVCRSRPRWTSAGLCLTLCGLAACSSPTQAGDAGSATASGVEAHRGLARHWAPRIYQDTDDSYAVADLITHFNFDGDYNGKNNWENLEGRTSVPAFVYYAVSETETHFFIHYALFHPRDWHEWFIAEMHENDLEGLSLAIQKTGGFGTLIAMETLAHDEFYQYSSSPDLEDGSDAIDGRVRLYDGTHPEVFVEAKGHGVYGCDSRCDKAPGGDGIVYKEADVAESPLMDHSNYTQEFAYKLIAMDADGKHDENQGLWYRRYDICDTCTFGSWGKLRGDNYGTDRAKTAWAWDDADDGDVFAGSMLCDPAAFFSAHFSGSAFATDFSYDYTVHPYATHSFQVNAVQSNANLDLQDGASDLYLRVWAPDSPAGSNELLTNTSWHVEDAVLGTWYGFGVRSGEAHAFGRKYHFCRPGNPKTRFEIYDSDTDPDDLMGALSLHESGDFSEGLALESAQLRFTYSVQ